VNKKNTQNKDRLQESDIINRVVTLALPNNTLRLLESIDQDLTRAIMALTDIAMQKSFPSGSSFEIIKVASGKSVFIVGSKTKLTKIPWINLVEIAPGRNLITIDSGISLELLEVAILELIETTPPAESVEQELLHEFCKYVGRLRRNKKMFKVEIMIVDDDV